MRARHWISAFALAAWAVCGLAGAADQIPWQTSLDAAQQLAAKSNRLVLIHFWAPWCEPCLRMDKEVFSRPEIARALEANFVMVKLNVDEAPGTARMYGVSSLPTDVIVAPPTGRLVAAIQSPPTAPQYIAQMNQAAAGYHDLARRAGTTPPAGAPGGAVAMPAGEAHAPEFAANQAIATTAPGSAYANPAYPAGGSYAQGSAYANPAATPAAGTSPTAGTTAPAYTGNPNYSNAPAYAGNPAHSSGSAPAYGTAPAYGAAPPAASYPQAADNGAAYPAGNAYAQSGAYQNAPPANDQPPAASAAGSAYANPSAPPTQSAYASEHYAEYFQRHQSSAGGQVAAASPPAYAPGSIGTVTPYGAPQGSALAYQSQAAAAPQSPSAPGYSQAAPSAAAPTYAPAAPNAAPAYSQAPPNTTPGWSAGAPGGAPLGPSTPALQLPPGSAPVGLDGYCPVTLIEKSQWVPGNKAFGVVHRGRTYVFVGPDEQKKFWSNPDRYSPVLSGNDPVLALDNRMSVPGRREFGVFYDNRVYLFADEASCRRFEQNPQRYSAEILQAMR